MKSLLLIIVLIITVSAKEKNKDIIARVGVVLSTTEYLAVDNKDPEISYHIRLANISTFNILQAKSRDLVERKLFGKTVKIKVIEIKGDTIIGDLEYRKENGKLNSITHHLVTEGLAIYTEEYKSGALKILQDKARDNRKGIWNKLDPGKIKFIQDSIKKVDQELLDSLINDVKEKSKPIQIL